jgi:DNA-binding NarL/FixJ family response regulator
MLPDLKIIVFSMFGDEDYYRRMLDLGVKGFILKTSGIEEVEQAIQSVMKGDTYFSNALPKKTLVFVDSKSVYNNDEEYQAPIAWW